MKEYINKLIRDAIVEIIRKELCGNAFREAYSTKCGSEFCMHSDIRRYILATVDTVIERRIAESNREDFMEHSKG